MASISYKEIASLSIEELKKTFPLSLKPLTLSCLKLGRQKENTIIIGNLTDFKRRKNANINSTPIMRLNMLEVLSSGPGLGFEAIVYGKNVKVLEDTLKSNDSTPTWVVFSNVTIAKYTGLIEPWSDFSLKVIDKDDDEARKQEITVFKQGKNSRKNETKLRYALIKDVTDKDRFSVFAVVKEVIKHTAVLNNNNKHTLLCIVDPSCFEPSAKWNELPLHIFFNEATDYLPDSIVHGDILRLREMLGDFYVKEEKMFGKIFNSNAVVKFKLTEEGNEVTPFTSNPQYELTDQDRKIVKNLRKWWKKNCTCYDDESQRNDSVLAVKKLNEIKKPLVFTLNCLIREVRKIESQKVVVLRVTDGTTAAVFTKTVNFDEATQEFSSQSTSVDTAIKTNEVDVQVFHGLFDKATELKKGDFVELVNVACDDITESGANNPVLDFYMRDPKCEINVFSDRSCKAKNITSAIEASKSKESGTPSRRHNTCKDEILSPTSTRSPRRTPSKRHQEKGQDVDQRIGEDRTHATNEKSSREIVHSPIYPALVDDIDLSHTETQDHAIVENGLGPHNDTVNENGNANARIALPDELSDAQVAGETSAEIPTAGTSSDCKMKRTPAVKRKLCYSSPSLCSESEPKKKMGLYVWQQQELNTVCSMARKASLTDFCVYSKGGDKCQAWAILKHIHYSSRQPCHTCQYLNCYHDWIWSLCSSCGLSLSSDDIRNRYPIKALLTQDSLMCHSCSSQSPNQEPTVQPFIKLELCLEDVHSDNSYSVDLSGDVAELFFGVKSSFKWVVGPVSSLLQERTNIYKQCNQIRPFQFCLINRTKPDGISSIQICDTKLKF